MKRIALLALAAIALTSSPSVADDDASIAFVGATVLDGAGGRKGDQTVVVQGGKVIGIGIAVPDGARRIEVQGAVLTPGLIDAACRAGFRSYDSEPTREMTAGVDVLDLIDVRSAVFSDAARAGCTTVVVVPGSRNVVAGSGRALNTHTAAGRAVPIEGAPRPLQVTLASNASRGNFPPRRRATTSIYARRPTTRMGVVWMLRQVFLAAKGVQEMPNDADLEPYRAVLDGKRTLRVLAHRNSDVTATLRIGDETGFTPVFEGGEEAHLSGGELARRKIPVILGPFPSERSGTGPDYTETALANARLLHAAGVRLALTAGSDGPRMLREQAMYAARYGLPKDVALAAVTGTAAAVCGLTDRGRIEKGKVADVVLWSGEPLAPTSRALVVLVNGNVVHDQVSADVKEKTR